MSMSKEGIHEEVAASDVAVRCSSSRLTKKDNHVILNLFQDLPRTI